MPGFLKSVTLQSRDAEPRCIAAGVTRETFVSFSVTRVIARQVHRREDAERERERARRMEGKRSFIPKQNVPNFEEPAN